ncbi:MAG: GNAT family N-acetyltransferase [Candidatus Thiodiazotropha lotti]|nr:GNAT family N-acetyltransferase [Candidatus Thiodiazotropha lotti]
MDNQIEESNLLVIREIQNRDAARFIELNRQIDLETKNMLLEPQERTTTLDQQEAIINKIESRKNQVIFIAEKDLKIVGFTVASGGDFVRNRQTASLVIGVRCSWWGMGIGRSLLNAIRQWAMNNSIHRLELTVRTDNSRAVSLYKSIGFVVEGRRVESLFVDGNYVDEYYMAMHV